MTGNPLGKFIRDFYEPAKISGIAQLYGLYVFKLEAQAQGEGGDLESQAAQADLTFLKGIVCFLDKRRATSIRWSGACSVATMRRVPCRILTIEQ